MLQGTSTWFEDLLEVLTYWPEIAKGFITTMWLYVLALAMGFALGLLFAVGRQYGGMILSRVATAYIEVVRGTPLLVQSFIIYFFPYSLSAVLEAQGSPPLFIRWSIQIVIQGQLVTILDHRLLSAILVLGLNSAAYQAEYFRGAVASVSAGQLLAARALGMSRSSGIVRVVLPQALRRVIPAWSNEATYLPVYTVAVYFIGVEELFAKAHFVVSRTFISLMTYALIALIFLVLVTIISKTMDLVHKWTRIPGL
jgi:polar amino acid transport system permease protein